MAVRIDSLSISVRDSIVNKQCKLTAFNEMKMRLQLAVKSTRR